MASMVPQMVQPQPLPTLPASWQSEADTADRQRMTDHM